MFDGALSPVHLLIVLLIVFLLFGAKRLPETGKALGTSIREFRKGISELHHEVDDDQPAQSPVEPPALEAPATPASVTNAEQTSREPSEPSQE